MPGNEWCSAPATETSATGTSTSRAAIRANRSIPSSAADDSPACSSASRRAPS